jgi:ABC-type molybdate transport system substrate-binding protein
MVAAAAHAQEPLKLYAAGSLRAALTDVGAAFTKAGGPPVVGEFGASGLLRDRLDRGERADVFASANMEHPALLSAAGKAGPVVMFARNRLCALAAPGLDVTTANLLDRLLDPSIKLGMSTPKADPSGDYALELFAKADKVRPGANAALTGKAVQLTGGPNSPPPPTDRSVYGMLIGERKADVVLTYCTNAIAAQRENAALAVVAVPEVLAVGANYGLTVMKDASRQGQRFAQFVLGDEAQRILARHGFGPPGSP